MKKASSGFKAVILAGGSGERFWPLSTPERPKQFLRVFGGESLIRQALARLDGLVAPEDAFVVTTKSLVAATRKELPEVPKGNIVGEPMRRDTGAAVALGVGMAAQRGWKPRLQTGGEADPVIGFFSSDQMVAKPKEFRKVVKKAVALARRKDAIVTIGIKPGYPATCFGYISPKTRTFVEKPDAEKAKKYVKAGYLWNAGMFIARASVFRGAFAAHAPELEKLANIGASAKSIAPAGLARLYAALPKISFDYAVMEKAKNVEVVPGDWWCRATSAGTTSAALPRSTSTSRTTRAATSAKGRARSSKRRATSASRARRASRFSASRISSSSRRPIPFSSPTSLASPT